MEKFLFLILVSSFSVKATSYIDFVDVVQKRCNLPNTLVIKKSYLSLMKDPKDCENSFIINLLNTCTPLTCDELISEFSLAQGEKSGNIIGGRQ